MKLKLSKATEKKTKAYMRGWINGFRKSEPEIKELASKICDALEPRIVQLCKKFATHNCNNATLPAFWIGAEADVLEVLEAKK